MINPTDKCAHFNIYTRNVVSSATETPWNQSSQLVISIIFTNQRSTAVTLENIKTIIKNAILLFRSHIYYTWQASFPSSPPAQKLLAGKMKIFSVTAFTFLIHSASLTIGISASRTRNGIGPAAKEIRTLLYILNI